MLRAWISPVYGATTGRKVRLRQTVSPRCGQVRDCSDSLSPALGVGAGSLQMASCRVTTRCRNARGQRGGRTGVV